MIVHELEIPFLTSTKEWEKEFNMAQKKIAHHF